MRNGETSAATREAILEAAAQLLAGSGPEAVTMPAVASAAGVSRQSVYLAWGGRGGLIAGMLRRAHTQSAAYATMLGIVNAPERAGALDHFIRAWCKHIPEIRPVARLLTVAAESDDDARAAIREETAAMRAMLAGILAAMRRKGALTPLWSPDEAVDLVWSLTHIDRWRHLVEECGWPVDLYTEETVALVERIVAR